MNVLTSESTEGEEKQLRVCVLLSAMQVKHVHLKAVGFDIFGEKIIFLEKRILTLSGYKSWSLLFFKRKTAWIEVLGADSHKKRKSEQQTNGRDANEA